MPVELLTSDEALASYEAFVRSHPHGSIWQSLSWKRYQESLGRQVKIYVEREQERIRASALLTIDRTVGGLSTWECPRGPLWSYELPATRPTGSSGRASHELMKNIISNARKERCIHVYVSPTTSLVQSLKLEARSSTRHVHPQATILLDLTLSEDVLLAQMREKGRYNIRLAMKHGIEVTQTSPQGMQDDLETFYRLLSETGKRDHFTIHPKRSYEQFLQNLDGSFLLIAREQKTPIAGLMGVIWHGTGIYYYGASSYEHRGLMAPYLLQWEAMRLCKAQGCHTYDLLGVDTPPRSSDSGIAAAESTTWSGLSDFKRKFGGRVIEYPPEQEIVLRPGLKKLLQMKRALLG